MLLRAKQPLCSFKAPHLDGFTLGRMARPPADRTHSGGHTSQSYGARSCPSTHPGKILQGAAHLNVWEVHRHKARSPGRFRFRRICQLEGWARAGGAVARLCRHVDVRALAALQKCEARKFKHGVWTGGGRGAGCAMLHLRKHVDVSVLAALSKCEARRFGHEVWAGKGAWRCGWAQ
eukprot:361168-Chlamydomonas_euryale.AAC.9